MFVSSLDGVIKHQHSLWPQLQLPSPLYHHYHYTTMTTTTFTTTITAIIAYTIAQPPLLSSSTSVPLISSSASLIGMIILVQDFFNVLSFTGKCKLDEKQTHSIPLLLDPQQKMDKHFYAYICRTRVKLHWSKSRKKMSSYSSLSTQTCHFAYITLPYSVSCHILYCLCEIPLSQTIDLCSFSSSYLNIT